MSAAQKQLEIWVVVCENDKAHPRWGVDSGGPIVHETYVHEASRQAAMKRAQQLEAYGACRIARLVFDDEPTHNHGA